MLNNFYLYNMQFLNEQVRITALEISSNGFSFKI